MDTKGEMGRKSREENNTTPPPEKGGTKHSHFQQ